jgi:hypothetical protein
MLDPHDEREEVPEPGSKEPEPKVYRAPAILWEQEFVALALISAPQCEPYSDPNCTP